jgi:alkyldihydroxyacetonephosphate synthase
MTSIEQAFATVVPVTTVRPEPDAWRDRWPLRGRSHETRGTPALICQPRTVAELQSVVRCAAEHAVALVPIGARSNVVGAIEPDDQAVLVDLRSLDRIGPLDEVSGTVRAEAGVLGGVLESWLADRGWTLGHDPQSLEISTVGGWIAMRASGVFSTGYGGIEQRLSGIEVVRADGSLLHLGRGPRSSVGPRLLELFTGSEGAFGIIAAGTLRVSPVPERRHFAAWSIPKFDIGLEQVRRLIQRRVVPDAVRLYDPTETRALSDRLGLSIDGCLLLLVFDGPSELTAVQHRLALAQLLEAGSTDLGPGPAQAWYADRHACEWLERGNAGPGSIADAIEIASDWARLPGLIERARAAAEPYVDEIWAHVSHAYPDGASAYFILFIRSSSDEAGIRAYRAAWQAIMETTLEARGTIAHHHGVGGVRLPWLETELGPGLDTLRAIKSALDPQRILNPGRLQL